MAMSPKRKRVETRAMANGTDGKGAGAAGSNKEPGAEEAAAGVTAAGQDAEVGQAAKKLKVVT